MHDRGRNPFGRYLIEKFAYTLVIVNRFYYRQIIIYGTFFEFNLYRYLANP